MLHLFLESDHLLVISEKILSTKAFEPGMLRTNLLTLASYQVDRGKKEKKAQVNLSSVGFYFILKHSPQYHRTVSPKGPEI